MTLLTYANILTALVVGLGDENAQAKSGPQSRVRGTGVAGEVSWFGSRGRW